MPLEKSPRQIERAVRQRLLRRFRASFPSPPKRFLLGFSGGSDSLALALVLKNAERALGAQVELIHIDHRLRDESADDADRARVLAERIRLPIIVIRLDGDPRSLHPQDGIEEAARRERFAAFAREMRDGDLLVLAHHAGDQAETMLLHLLRGAGLRGVAGMSEVSSLQVPWWRESQSRTAVPIWRPFLRESRAEIRTIAQGSGLDPIEDPSNTDTTLRRNAIRLGVVPEIAQVDPAFERHFGDFADIAREEDALLDRMTSEAFEAAVVQDRIDATALSRFPVALARRVLRRWLTNDDGEATSFDRIEAVRQLASEDDHSAMIEVAGDTVVGNLAGTLIRGTRRELMVTAWRDSGMTLPLATEPQTIHIDGDRVIVRAPVAHRVVVIFSLADNPSGTISVRRIVNAPDNSGDRDIWRAWYRERGISPWIRAEAQGIAIDGQICWIPMNDDRPADLTGRCIQVEVIPE